MAMTFPPSPISVADLAGKRLRLGDGFICGDRAYWVQSDPNDGGRSTLVTKDSNGNLVDLTPDFDLRTSVHEYGGTAAAVCDCADPHYPSDPIVCFYDNETDSVVVREPDGDFLQVSAGGPWVYGGFQFLDPRHVVTVREDHSPELAEPQDSIVVLDLDSDNADGGHVIAQGADFYFSPAVSPDGWIAWMEYDHPSIPWDSTRIIALAPDGTRHTVADTPGVSAAYPQWGVDGSLYFLSDESGYWNFHRWDKAEVTRLHDHPYDFCLPPWVLSPPPYALLPGDGTRIGCSWWQDGFCHLGILELDARLTELGVYGALSLAPATSGLSVIGYGTPTSSASLAVLDWETGSLTDLVQESTLEVPPDSISVPDLVRWQASNGDDVTGWYYPPTVAVAGPPPCLVLTHGGPTSYSPAVYSLVVQYFTTRGIAVFDVNYSGSSTMGRAYRERLDGNWGILDVRDCVDGVRHLVGLGLADPTRLAIMGGSAGGFTTLACLTGTDIFSAGISMYGIADLESLARDTSKFESHYTDSLVAPYPEGRDVYAERSPINHVDQLSCPLLLLQGTEDQVVPPNQAQAMYDAVRAKGLEAELVLYDGEGHGFRQASTLEDAYTRILAFLGEVWG